MTNLQKYPNTRDALNAWAEYQECGGMYTFAYWINLPCADVDVEEKEEEEEGVVDRFRPEGGDINQDRLDNALKGLCRAVWKVRPRVPSAECGGDTDNVMHPSHRANPDDRTKKENHINENRVH